MNDDMLYGITGLVGVVGVIMGIGWILINKEKAFPALANGKKTTLKDKIDYTRSAMYTAYDSQDVSEYIRLQRELELLELEIN